VSLFTILMIFNSIIHHTSSSQLNLWEGETIVFNSAVEAQSLRRRASRLLPIPVPPVKSRTRQLILTTQRLFCLKQQQKGPGSLSIKSELTLRASDKVKEKEKESRAAITSVELKGEREFVVLTVRFYPSAILFLSLMCSHPTTPLWFSRRRHTVIRLKTYLSPPTGCRIFTRLLHRMDDNFRKHGRKSITPIQPY